MAYITSQNAAQAIVKLIATEALEALEGTMIMGQLVNRDFEAVLANAGDTVNVPMGPYLSANNMAEGGTLTPQAASLGSASITLNCHVESSFAIPDVTKILVQPDLTKLFMNAAILAVAERVETDLMNLYSLLTDVTAVGGVAAISEGVIDDAETALFKQRVPGSEPKIMVVSADTYADIRQIPRFTENQTIGLPATISLQDGTVGKIKNFNIVRSHFVQKPSTTAYNIAFARDAFGLVTRRLPQPIPGTGAIAEYAEKAGFGMRVVMSYNPNSLAQQFTVDILYGVGVLRNNFGLQVQTNT